MSETVAERARRLQTRQNAPMVRPIGWHYPKFVAVGIALAYGWPLPSPLPIWGRG